MKIGIIDLCKQIEDPRMNRKKVHKMETIIYISIAAVICGAQSWNEIEEFGNAKIAFFKSRIPGQEFIPSHDTFNRFFSIIKPEYFELIFRNWVKQVCQEVKGVVAIDGKLCVVQANVTENILREKKDSNYGWFPPGLPLMEFL